MPGASKATLTRLREEFVVRLWTKGYRQRRIADEFAKPENAHLHGLHKNGGTNTLSQPAIHKIIKRVEARVIAAANTDVERIKKEQTAILHQNIEDLRDAYEKSTQAQVHQKQKTQNVGAAATDKAKGPKGYHQTEIGQKTQVGDHSILGEMRQHLSEIRKIWGADAPVKTDSTIHGEMAVTGQDLSKLTDDELETLRALQEKLTAPTPTSAGSVSAAGAGE